MSCKIFVGVVSRFCHTHINKNTEDDGGKYLTGCDFVLENIFYLYGWKRKNISHILTVWKHIMNTGWVILKYECRAFTISYCLFISCHYFSIVARIWLWTNTTKDTAWGVLFKRMLAAERWSNITQSCQVSHDISGAPLTFNGASWNIQVNLTALVTPCIDINQSAGVVCIRDLNIATMPNDVLTPSGARPSAHTLLTI